MTTATKTFLAISIVGLVAGGIVDFCVDNVNPVWTATMPIGAVFLGLFLVSLVLENEIAAFNAEEAKKLELVRAYKNMRGDLK